MPYHIESSRAKCKGPKKTCPVEDRKIQGGELRLGSEIEGAGYTGVAWRHWKCTTPKVLENLSALDNIEEELLGFTELHDEDQERVKKALEDGHVSESEEAEDEEKEEKEEKAAKPKAAKKASKKTAAADEKEKSEKPAAAKRGRAKKEEAEETKPEPKKRGRKPKSDEPAAEDSKDENAEKTEKPAAKKRKSRATKAE